MEVEKKFRIRVSKMGAELKRVEKKLEAAEEKMQVAMWEMKIAMANLEMTKDQLKKVKGTWEEMYHQMKNDEERAKLEESLNNDLSLRKRRKFRKRQEAPRRKRP